MSYFLTNLIVETSSPLAHATIEKDEQFQKQYKDIYESLFSLNEHLKDLNKYVRNMNPKLYFLSDICLMEIYYYIYNEPSKALDLIKYCYDSIESFIYKEKKTENHDKNDDKNDDKSQDKSYDKSHDKNEKKLLEIIGFKNYSNECYFFERCLIISEKQTSSLEFLGFVMKYLDDLPNLIKRNFFSFFNTNLTNNFFNWPFFCKMMLNSQEKYQIVFLFIEVCFYHNLAISLEMDDIDKEKISLNFSKKQYLLADISDEETIRGHKLKYFYEKICRYLTEVINLKEFAKSPHNQMKYSQFILEIIKYKDILEVFINKNVNETNNFHYLSLPKLSLNFDKDFCDKNLIKSQEIVDNTIRKVKTFYEKIPENGFFIENDSDFLKLAMKNECELYVTAMNYKQIYGYQPMILSENWVHQPQTPQYLVMMIGTLATASSTIVTGASKIGKKSLLKVKSYKFIEEKIGEFAIK